MAPALSMVPIYRGDNEAPELEPRLHPSLHPRGQQAAVLPDQVEAFAETER